MKKICVACGVIFLILFESCHSNYLSTKLTLGDDLAFSPDSSSFIFLAKIDIFRRPTGIARFPDGGQSKYEFTDVAFYSFNLSDSSVTRVYDLNNTLLLCNDLNYNYADLELVGDSLLAFKIDFFEYALPFYLKRCVNHADSAKGYEVYNFLKSAYVLNIKNDKLYCIDSLEFAKINNKSKPNRRAREYVSYLTSVPLDAFGIDLENIWPDVKDDYVDYLVLKEGDERIRKSIISKICSCSNFDIDKIVNMMEKRREHLKRKDEKSIDYKDSLTYIYYNEYFNKIVPLLKECQNH
ncbi:hypothetical protein [Tenuifilum thalassicum]|uniref:Uncharacterized protein n=1 Tax=Tenuifilum thalassicum TaxID=2590900 RepID=A0A7D3XWJ1_9BACT|nr:hypothetical protein [Tenuifilum thalassicum]QKG80788.1 hypothetical protein FHG85_11105 [Tenuifilum thalassicum]